MDENQNRAGQDDPTENIAGYDVSGKIEYLGPIVWHDTSRLPDGTRITNFESVEVSALPPELTAHQTNVSSFGLIGGVLEEYLLPELSRRLGKNIHFAQVISSFELITEALVIIPPQGAPIVHLVEEAAQAEIPADHAWIRLQRERYTWHLHGNWLPQFPKPVIDDVRASAGQLAEAIINADEEKAKELARLSFPTAWKDSPKSLRDDMHKEIFVLLFNLSQSLSPGSDPLETVKAQYPKAVKDLGRDYSLEVIKAEAEERGNKSNAEFVDLLADMELLFRRARLSDRQLTVVRLEAALEIRGVSWFDEDKEKLLNMRPGTFRDALYSARVKIRGVRERQVYPYKHLLEVIFQGSEGEPR